MTAQLALPRRVSVPSPNYSARGGATVRLIVVHDCEGSSQGAVSWFSQTRSRVSAHAVLSEDGLLLTEMVDWSNKAWHACNANSISEGIEMGGVESHLFPEAEWQAMAVVVAWRLKVRGLPPVWAQHGNGAGFCSHYDLGQAGGGHTDPTTDSDVWARFCAMVQAAYDNAPGVPLPKSQTVGFIAKPPDGWAPHGTVRHDHPVGSIEWVQLELNALSVPFSPLIVDGMVGPETEHAVRQFQLSRGLVADGLIGPATIKALGVA